MTLYRSINPGDNVTILARLQSDITGTVFAASDVQSIMLTITNQDSQTFITAALAVSECITAVAVDPRWTADRTGSNFSCTIAGSNFPEASTTYEAVIVVTPYTGEPQQIVAQIQTRELLGVS